MPALWRGPFFIWCLLLSVSGDACLRVILLFTANNSILRKKALWGISSSAKEGRWKVFFVDSHRSLTVLYRGGLYWRAISFESICVGSNPDLVVWVSRWYSGDKRAELIEMLMEILIKTLIKTCAHCPRFLCGTFFFFFLTWLNNPPIQDRTLRVSFIDRNKTSKRNFEGAALYIILRDPGSARMIRSATSSTQAMWSITLLLEANPSGRPKQPEIEAEFKYKNRERSMWGVK